LLQPAEVPSWSGGRLHRGMTRTAVRIAATPAHQHVEICCILLTLSAFPLPVAECGRRATDDWKGTRVVEQLRHFPFAAKSGYSPGDRNQLVPYKAIQSHRLLTHVCG